MSDVVLELQQEDGGLLELDLAKGEPPPAAGDLITIYTSKNEKQHYEVAFLRRIIESNTGRTIETIAICELILD